QRTFWSPNWSRTRDHGSILNGTDRHARPIFAIHQHLSGQNETGRNGHQQILSAVPSDLSALSVAAKEIYLVWPPSYVTVRGPKRWDDRWSRSSKLESPTLGTSTPSGTYASPILGKLA